MHFNVNILHSNPRSVEQISIEAKPPRNQKGSVAHDGQTCYVLKLLLLPTFEIMQPLQGFDCLRTKDRYIDSNILNALC
jgi:hypothetical protein